MSLLSTFLTQTQLKRRVPAELITKSTFFLGHCILDWTLWNWKQSVEVCIVDNRQMSHGVLLLLLLLQREATWYSSVLVYMFAFVQCECYTCVWSVADVWSVLYAYADEIVSFDCVHRLTHGCFFVFFFVHFILAPELALAMCALATSVAISFIHRSSLKCWLSCK